MTLELSCPCAEGAGKQGMRRLPACMLGPMHAGARCLCCPLSGAQSESFPRQPCPSSATSSPPQLPVHLFVNAARPRCPCGSSLPTQQCAQRARCFWSKGPCIESSIRKLERCSFQLLQSHTAPRSLPGAHCTAGPSPLFTFPFFAPFSGLFRPLDEGDPCHAPQPSCRRLCCSGHLTSLQLRQLYQLRPCQSAQQDMMQPPGLAPGWLRQKACLSRNSNSCSSWPEAAWQSPQVAACPCLHRPRLTAPVLHSSSQHQACQGRLEA